MHAGCIDLVRWTLAVGGNTYYRLFSLRALLDNARLAAAILLPSLLVLEKLNNC
jgi:hypothetical protein